MKSINIYEPSPPAPSPLGEGKAKWNICILNKNKIIKDYKQNLIKGAHSNLFEFAKDMRKESTKAEQILWERLRRNALGFKFRRQHPIKNFIPDFYCHTKKLAIELNGSPHFNIEGKEYDKFKEEQLQTENILVLRFPNSMVERKIEKVLEIILKKLNRLI